MWLEQIAFYLTHSQQYPSNHKLPFYMQAIKHLSPNYSVKDKTTRTVLKFQSKAIIATCSTLIASGFTCYTKSLSADCSHSHNRGNEPLTLWLKRHSKRFIRVSVQLFLWFRMVAFPTNQFVWASERARGASKYSGNCSFFGGISAALLNVFIRNFPNNSK